MMQEVVNIVGNSVAEKVGRLNGGLIWIGKRGKYAKKDFSQLKLMVTNMDVYNVGPLDVLNEIDKSVANGLISFDEECELVDLLHSWVVGYINNILYII